MTTTAPAPAVSLEDQVTWLRGAVARERNYQTKASREGKAHPAYARQQVLRAEATLATLERVLYGEKE
jgi:hypothetical protein